MPAAAGPITAHLNLEPEDGARPELRGGRGVGVAHSLQLVVVDGQLVHRHRSGGPLVVNLNSV